MSVLKIGGAIVNQTPLDWEGNFQNIEKSIEEAKKQGVNILCFPELSITDYGSEDLFLNHWYIIKALSYVKKSIPLSSDITLCIGTPLKEITGELLTTAYQGSKISSTDTLESAKFLSESIGATFYNWEISEEVASYTKKVEEALERKLTWEQDDIALQNIQARTRSPIIWMLANVKKSLLLTTSNRSEGDVGYATMDGGTSGSLSPIAAVDKSFAQEWLKWTETDLGYEGLSHVNAIAPTAELRPLDKHQTDEEDLMPYQVIFEIEKLAIRDKIFPMDIFLILKEEMNLGPAQLKNYIRRFFHLWSRNQWKKERIAPSFHLDEFNVDPKTWYRFPILSGGFREELKELETMEEE